jgi:hypothetical protein
MAANPQLLQNLITIMQQDHPAAFFLNKQSDVYKFAQALFDDIEQKRSSVTAITKAQAQALSNSLQFSSVKHESYVNALYRLIGLPTELDLLGDISILDANGKTISNVQDLSKTLVQREFEQLKVTFKQFLANNSTQDLNTQLNSIQATEEQLIAQLFDPNTININRLFPIVQYSQVQDVVEPANRIAPSFASTQERYVNETMMKPAFLESVITIRLLQQSGGAQINNQGAVEDAILQSLGYALGELVKQYNRNQTEAEKHLLDGIALIRNKPNGVNSAAVKQASLDANTRENDNIVVESDIRSQYTQGQIALYDAIISLLPTENDVIPIGTSIGNTPFQSRSIKDNALTSSFLNIINSNVDALQRSIDASNKVLQKRQLTQDKLDAELSSNIGIITGISQAEVIIVIAALFVLDEEDLVGLLSQSRFDQLIAASNNNTSASGSTIDNTGQVNTPQKQINIFDILAQFKTSTSNSKPKTPTTQAVQILQGVIKAIYGAFVVQLRQAHILPSS